MTRRIERALLLALFCGWATSRASAQGPPDLGTPVPSPEPAFQGIKHHASFMISGGFDLDVFGNFIEGGLGARDGHQIAVRQALPWPSVYIAVPRRAQASVGFGVFQHDEIVARASKADYVGGVIDDIGNLAGTAGNETVTIAFSQYHERAWEAGWRHYLVMTRRVKQYVNMLYGIRTVQPISGTYSTSGPEGTLGTLRLYDESRCKTVSLEMGLSVEVSHVGFFVEAGFRWQQKLNRQDNELAAWSLQPVNNTGLRFYIPAQFGIVFRL